MTNDATPPPPLPPTADHEEMREALKGVQGDMRVILSGMVDLSSRLGKVENAINASSTVYMGPERRVSQPSWTSEAIRTVHDETLRQTPKLDSMMPLVTSTAVEMKTNITRQWLTIALIAVNALATFAYAYASSHSTPTAVTVPR